MQHVVDGPLGYAGLEPLLAALGRDPARHVSAVRSAEHAEPLAVDEIEAAYGFVDHGQHVVMIDAAPAGALILVALGPPDRPAPRLAVAGRAPRVGVHDGVAGAGLHLEFVEEPVA